MTGPEDPVGPRDDKATILPNNGLDGLKTPDPNFTYVGHVSIITEVQRITGTAENVIKCISPPSDWWRAHWAV